MAPATYNEDTAFERVMQACRAAEAKGWEIARGHFLSRKSGVNYCCPIGAFLVEMHEAAAKLPLQLFGAGTDVERTAAIRLWRAEMGLPRTTNASDFVRVIDRSGRITGKGRETRLALRVRAALWPDGDA